MKMERGKNIRSNSLHPKSTFWISHLIYSAVRFNHSVMIHRFVSLKCIRTSIYIADADCRCKFIQIAQSGLSLGHVSFVHGAGIRDRFVHCIHINIERKRERERERYTAAVTTWRLQLALQCCIHPQNAKHARVRHKWQAPSVYTQRTICRVHAIKRFYFFIILMQRGSIHFTYTKLCESEACRMSANNVRRRRRHRCLNRAQPKYI